jgi:hypothetical protein
MFLPVFQALNISVFGNERMLFMDVRAGAVFSTSFRNQTAALIPLLRFFFFNQESDGGFDSSSPTFLLQTGIRRRL